MNLGLLLHDCFLQNHNNFNIFLEFSVRILMGVTAATINFLNF